MCAHFTSAVPSYSDHNWVETLKLALVCCDVSSSLRDASFNIHELNKSPCCVVFLYFIVCSGKISDGRDNLEDNIIEVKAMVKSIKSLVQW